MEFLNAYLCLIPVHLGWIEKKIVDEFKWKVSQRDEVGKQREREEKIEVNSFSADLVKIN